VLSIILFCIAIVTMVGLCPHSSRFYYAKIRSVPENISTYVGSTGACIPLGTALVFVDADNLAGYIYFEKIFYNQAHYVVKSFSHQNETIKRGVLTTWKKWPWSRSSPYLEAVYIGSEDYPHFSWTPPFCFLHFDRSKIVKVNLMPLEKVHEALDGRIPVTWLEADYIGDRVHKE